MLSLTRLWNYHQKACTLPRYFCFHDKKRAQKFDFQTSFSHNQHFHTSRQKVATNYVVCFCGSVWTSPRKKTPWNQQLFRVVCAHNDLNPWVTKISLRNILACLHVSLMYRSVGQVTTFLLLNNFLNFCCILHLSVFLEKVFLLAMSKSVLLQGWTQHGRRALGRSRTCHLTWGKNSIFALLT